LLDTNQIPITLKKPHKAQKQVLDSKARFIVLMCGRRWGKSLICQNISIQDALQGKLVAYITPTYQLAKVFFEDMTKIIPNEIVSVNKSDLTFHFITGGVIRFFTGEKLDNLRGQKFHRAILDEAPYIKNLEKGWLNSIRPTLTDFKGSAIFVSTPRGKDFFYSLTMKNGENGWESFKFTTYDNPFIDKEEIDEAKRQLPGPVFEQEYLANPMENAANPFGSQNIRDCIKPMTSDIVCFGIDLAKSYDWSVIIGLDHSGNVSYFDRFQKDWHTTKQVIKSLPKKPILLDSTGVGDPIFEELQREGLMVEGLKFTQNSKQQLMVGLQNAIHQKAISYPSGIIVDELEIFEYQFTANGVKYSAPSGFHDDCVMALALAWSNYSYRMGRGTYSFL
jgi:hypothetical protein